MFRAIILLSLFVFSCGPNFDWYRADIVYTVTAENAKITRVSAYEGGKWIELPIINNAVSVLREKAFLIDGGKIILSVTCSGEGMVFSTINLSGVEYSGTDFIEIK